MRRGLPRDKEESDTEPGITAGEMDDRMFRDLVESLSHVVFTLDDSGRFTYLSPRCEAILGIPPEQLVGRHITSVVVPADRDRLCSRFRGVQAGSAYPSDYHVVDRDGKVHAVRGVSRPFRRQDGTTGVAGIISEIDNWLTAEEALKSSEELVKKIITYSRDGILLTDESGCVLEWSPALEQITGVPRTSAVGRPFREVQYGMLPAERQNPGTGGLPGGPAPFPAGPGGVYEICLPGQSRREIESCRFQIPTENGNMLASIVRDITDRKKSENALRQANRQLNLLASVTRHDISNKVVVILGYLDLAMQKTQDPTLVKYFEKIDEATREIHSQIAFTKVYQEIGSTAPRWHDVGILLGRLSFPKNIALESGVSGLCIFADAMLERVFFNLLDNAIRHGGHVTKIAVTAEKTADGLVLIWEDDGSGVAVGEKERIFERGYGNNTGLGLFLVREILALTGITIRETGGPGHGARFEILIPEGKYRYGAQ